MNIYLPIAEMSVNIFMLLGLGGIIGLLSGLFGVGGGFLMTPLLIFIGVSPSVSVSTGANQMVATSLSGFLAHWRRENVDFKIGFLMLIGGILGSSLGVEIFRWLKQMGYIDLIISVIYVVFLGGIGVMMACESVRAILKVQPKPKSSDKPPLASRLPFQIDFPKSKLRISALMPLLIGFACGIMASLMGIGGSFFLIPAMIYLLGMPTSVVIGTSLFQVIFITANVTLLQAISTQTVDIMLALILLTGSVIGAQFGSKIGAKLPAEYLRASLAAIVLGVAVKLAFGLFATPSDIYSVGLLE